jgi:hypothetical protein
MGENNTKLDARGVAFKALRVGSAKLQRVHAPEAERRADDLRRKNGTEIVACVAIHAVTF